MMTTRRSLYIHVLMVVVAAGLLFIAGTGMVQAAGKQCPAKLNTCKAKLNTCKAKLSTCKKKLSQAQGNLKTCNANLGTCNTNLTESEANLENCEADLADCQAAATAFPATGQTTSFRAGDDGDLEAGADLSYTDNLDGTITDNNTGLQWEKKSDDGSINDRDTTYTWENAFAVHVAGLNTVPCFAGFCDWRLPNVKELQSIVNYGTFNPSVSLAFNDCQANDTVLTGSCTAASNYWSSTTLAIVSGIAWFVDFNFGSVSFNNKTFTGRVRAVRGGL